MDLEKGQIALFPIEVFPDRLQVLVNTVAQSLPCPVDFPAVMVLPVLGTCIGLKRAVEVKRGWLEYPLLWAMVVAESGDRKTPAFKEATQPLRNKLRQMQSTYRQDWEKYKALPKENREGATKPVLKQTHSTDATIESLKNVLDSSPDGICYPADELSGWVRGMGQYKSGQGNDRQNWLQIWSGVQVVCNRSGKEPVIIDNPFVAVVGGIQPDCIEDVINDGKRDGGAARILTSYPDPVIDTDWTDDTIEGADGYMEACEKLWGLQVTTEPVVLSAEAKERWVQWVNVHRKNEPHCPLKPFWAKCEGYCARLALIIHLTRWAYGEATDTTMIDATSMHGAIELIKYFKSHAKRVYAAAAIRKDDSRIGKALRWIREHGGKVTAVQINQCKVAGADDADKAKALLNELAELGHGTVTHLPRNSVVFHLSIPLGI